MSRQSYVEQLKEINLKREKDFQNKELQKALNERKQQIEEINKKLSRDDLQLKDDDLQMIKAEEDVTDNYITSLETVHSKLALFNDLLGGYIQISNQNLLALGSQGLIEKIKTDIDDCLENTGKYNNERKKEKYNIIVENYQIMIGKQEQFKKSIIRLISQLEQEIKTSENPIPVEKKSVRDKSSKQEEVDEAIAYENTPLLSSTQSYQNSTDAPILMGPFESIPKDVFLEITKKLTLAEFERLDKIGKTFKNSHLMKEAWRQKVLEKYPNFKKSEKDKLEKTKDPRQLLINTLLHRKWAKLKNLENYDEDTVIGWIINEVLLGSTLIGVGVATLFFAGGNACGGFCFGGTAFCASLLGNSVLFGGCSTENQAKFATLPPRLFAKVVDNCIAPSPYIDIEYIEDTDTKPASLTMEK